MVIVEIIHSFSDHKHRAAVMNISVRILWLVQFMFSCQVVTSLNILALFPYPGKSHFFVFQPYLQELARRGHNVTVVSPFPRKEIIENYHDISLAGKYQAVEGTFKAYRTYRSVLEVFLYLYDKGKETCEVMLADKHVQHLWKSDAKFDVVVIERFNTECGLGLAYKLGAPVVGLTSHVPMPWHFEPHGIVYNPSYVPYMLLEGGTKPSLYQRIERFYFYNVFNFLYKHWVQKVNQKQLLQYFDVPPLEELAQDINFLLLYTNFVVNGAYGLPPNAIEVGGYHIAQPKELPSEIKKFIDESEHGVLYISFGSMLLSTSLPEKDLKYIVDAVSELPQRVIWKWDAKELPGNPKNVYLSNWLPQNDILAHPKVLAFYSHCGMLGTTEAIYHGVPIVGMPILGDQPTNAAAVEESGLGVQIQIAELTKEDLLHKLKTVLDPEFRKNVKKLSRMWHDRPMTAMDTAIYWTEFAARTKNYTFKSPVSSISFYQYYYLDIIAVNVGTLLLIVFVIKKLLSFIINKMFRTAEGVATKQKRNKKIKTT